MNLLSFLKRKQSEGVPKLIPKNTRMQTQAHFIPTNKKSKAKPINSKFILPSPKEQKSQKIQRFETSIVSRNDSSMLNTQKTTLNIKQLLRTLWAIKDAIQEQYDSVLTLKLSPQAYSQLIQLLSTNYFRFRPTTLASALEHYLSIIQGLQLLISKLTNNQKLPQTISVRNQQQFVLFFKLFFSKPYTLINLAPVRKIIKLLWDSFVIPNLHKPKNTPNTTNINPNIQNMTNHLKLWIYGIAAPLNPAMNKLHRYCVQHSQQISKHVTHKSNHFVYVGINDSDILGLTPLKTAAIARNNKAMEKLIKNGADPYCCPLTINSRKVQQSKQENRYCKIMFKKQYGINQRGQCDTLELLKQQNRLQQLGQIMCWHNYYHKKHFRKDNSLGQMLSLMPDCSFQIDWKQYKGMLSFSRMGQDIISIYKRDKILRIDFHSGESVQNKARPHHSIIFKVQEGENQLWMVSHHLKSIVNLLVDKSLIGVRQKYSNYLKYGNIYHQQVNSIKSIYIPEQARLTSQFDTYYQNVLKSKVPIFRTQKEYLQQCIQSEMVNYQALQQNQIKAILSQNVITPPKIKSKVVSSSCSADLQWANQSLNITHLQFLLSIGLIAFPASILLSKISSLLLTLQDPIYYNLSFLKKLPIRGKYTGEQGSLQYQLKNIRYHKVEQSVFKVQVRAKQMNYQQCEQQVDLSHLRDTVYMDEMYSIRASRFIGNSQEMIEQEEGEVNRRFDQMLRLGGWSNEEQEDK